jgi:hypothetical protein
MYAEPQQQKGILTFKIEYKPIIVELLENKS